jgi:hypothetical protein
MNTEEKTQERAEEKNKEPTKPDYKVDDRRGNRPAEVENKVDDRRDNRPTSTAEVARNLERTETDRKTDRKSSAAAATLFADNEAKDFRARWTEIQTAFVDEPRRAVEQADALVAEVIQRLANSFSQARSTLEGQWGRGDNVSTKDLRVTLQRYRAFFDRLLNV